MGKRAFLIAAMLFIAASSLPQPAAGAAAISLAGTWRFQLDPQNIGRQQGWSRQGLPQPDAIFLPASTDQAGYGARTKGPEKGWLSRPWTYEGPAWYERDVFVPESWRGKRITLFLERPHWETRVWVDGSESGSQNSLAVPHVYDLSGRLEPGRRRLTICVDNSYKIDVGRNAHSVTDHTQTNWNGIVGRIELRATDPVWIDSAVLYPNIKERTARVEVTVRNITGQKVDGELQAVVCGIGILACPTPNKSPGKATGRNAYPTATFKAAGEEEKLHVTIPIGPDARLWDESDPALYGLQLRLSAHVALGAKDGDLKVGATSPQWQSEWSQSFGMREIRTRGTQFVLNGRPVFLRGTVECAIFPLTGYPPTGVAAWERIFKIARSYGLNHFRFHSWCPPEAAFQAADRNGFLLHVELPVWSGKVGTDAALSAFMRDEGYRILAAYGNHPSFTMLCLGNELRGDFGFMDSLVAEFKRADARRLYTFSSDHVRRVPGASSDYYVTHHTKAGPVRIHGARFQDLMNGTDFDFTSVKEGIEAPLVAHELGQWVVYPNYDEIPKYTGVLKPRNLEVFRDKLAERGMLEQAASFQSASGHFAWLLYKEEIETALRTPNFGGFQLLQLHDFPGQGEALVGLLNSLWESKSILTPEEFRRFCSPTVPLLRFSKFVWTADETFTAKAELAHYGKAPLERARATWTIHDEAGRRAGSGELGGGYAPVGSVTALGKIVLPLSGVKEATRLRVAVRLNDMPARNDWDIWVYPKQLDTTVPAGAIVSHAFDEATRAALAEGRKVLLLWPAGRKNDQMLPIHFLPVFWSLSWFKSQPGTLGVLCNPRHPALAGFPTDPHSNWQWWELTEKSQAFILNETPAALRPIVQVIDDYHRNHKLGAVFQARVGGGRLLVSSFDLESNLDRRPAARQLLRSLLDYAGSDRFNPQVELSVELLARLLK